MGTYDKRGGSPISPNEPDVAPSKLVDAVLAVLEAADVPTEVNDKIVALIESSEAGAERQEYWCPFKDSACGDDPAKRCVDCAQPAKGDAS